MELNVLTGDYVAPDTGDKVESENILKQFSKYPFSLDHFQRHAVERIHRNQHVLICVPTGSGKTLVATEGIFKALNDGKKVIYTSPIKTLSNQKFAEFRAKFPSTSVGIVTGDIKLNPDAQILIMTTEILRNLLYRSRSEDGTVLPDKHLGTDLDIEKEVGVVIYDEVHYINDRDRGKVWEESLINMPKHIILVLLSATITRPEVFGDWLQSISTRQVNLIKYNSRPVPLEHTVFYHFGKISKTSKANKRGDFKRKCDMFNESNGKLVVFCDKNGNYYNDRVSKLRNLYDDWRLFSHYKRVSPKSILLPLIDTLKKNDLMPALVFCFSRKKCGMLARSIPTSLNTSDEGSLVERIMMKAVYRLENPKLYVETDEWEKNKALWKKGVAVHHSGLLPIYKEIVEILFGQKLIKMLFATETFAVGVNMPTKTVIFTALSKYSDTGFRMLNTAEYLQMSGRAGRRGLDKKGTVIILPNIMDLPEPTELKNLVVGLSPPISSKFTLNYSFILQALLNDESRLRDVTENSLLHTEYSKQIKQIKYEIENNDITEPEWMVDINIMRKWDKIEAQLNNTGEFKVRIKRSKRRELENQIELFNSDKLNVRERKRWQNYHYRIRKDSELRNKLNTLENMLDDELRRSLDFLENVGAVCDTEDKSMDELGIKNVKRFGIIVSNLNEVNELLCAEMIERGHFKDITPRECIALLSIFLTTKPISDYTPPSFEEMGLSSVLTERMFEIYNRGQELLALESKYGIDVGNDYNVHDTMTEFTYKWVCNDSITLNDLRIPFFKGNFIKDMLKLNAIVSEIQNIAEIIGDTDLYKKMTDCSTLLIRDEVSPDSLYLSDKPF